MKNLSIVKNKDFNQELSIAARKEFAKGNINIAWAMELKANTLVEGTTKEQWYQGRRSRAVCESLACVRFMVPPLTTSIIIR